MISFEKNINAVNLFVIRNGYNRFCIKVVVTYFFVAGLGEGFSSGVVFSGGASPRRLRRVTRVSAAALSSDFVALRRGILNVQTYYSGNGL